MIIRTLTNSKQHARDVPGNCAHCGMEVFEGLPILDDCYNVWAGKCPSCDAINLLSMSYGLRGYDSQKMVLVLPTDEEIEANAELPEGIPSSRKSGKPADMHGSPVGEICHQLRDADEQLPSNRGEDTDGRL